MTTQTKYVAVYARLIGLAILALQCSSTIAGPPTIESIWPPVGQRGCEFQVKIVGSALAQTQHLMFYSPHLNCKNVQVNSEYEVIATIQASETCQLGYVPFRVVAKDGFSELRTLRITPFPIVLEERGDDVTAPILLQEINVTICGVLGSAEHDRYAVALKSGQEIAVEVDAVRLGGELLDTVVSVVGPNGEVLARADDNPLFQQDPTLSFTAEQDGTYIIDLHESNYDGSENSYYAVHIGEFPAASAVYPAGGQIGTSLTIQSLGDTNRERFLSVELPADENQAKEFQLHDRQGTIIAPSAIPFRVSYFANVLETEPNDQPNAQLPSFACPIAFNGILQTQGDIDCFAFQAELGQPLLVEAFANRIGSPADTVIAILDSRFETIAANDDWGSHDSRIEFHPPQSGRYYLTVTDKLAAGGRDAVYRVELSPLQPSVTAFLPRPDRLSQQSQAIAIPQGNRVVARIGVRRQLVDGKVRMDLLDLPSGVQASPIEIPPDQFWVPVVLEAKSDASLGAQLVNVKAICESVDGEVEGQFEHVVDLVSESADQLFQSARVSRLPIAVTPPVPFVIDLQQPVTSLASGGTIDLVVTVVRSADFAGPVRVELPFLPPWVVAESHLVIPADQDRGIYRLEASEQAAARKWPLVATGRVDSVTATEATNELDGREVASKLVELTIEPSPISGQFESLAAEQGQTIDVQCLVKKLSVTPEKLVATLEGLPNRVSAPPVAFDPSNSTIDFKLSLQEDAPIGQFESVQCRLSGEIEGQSISFVIAANSKLQISAPGKLFRNKSGRVLSPLESLRQQRGDSNTATADSPSNAR